MWAELKEEENERKKGWILQQEEKVDVKNGSWLSPDCLLTFLSPPPFLFQVYTVLGNLLAEAWTSTRLLVVSFVASECCTYVVGSTRRKEASLRGILDQNFTCMDPFLNRGETSYQTRRTRRICKTGRGMIVAWGGEKISLYGDLTTSCFGKKGCFSILLSITHYHAGGGERIAEWATLDIDIAGINHASPSPSPSFHRPTTPHRRVARRAFTGVEFSFFFLATLKKNCLRACSVFLEILGEAYVSLLVIWQTCPRPSIQGLARGGRKKNTSTTTRISMSTVGVCADLGGEAREQ